MTKLLEQVQVVQAGAPKDVNASALTGDYVSLKNYNKLTILVNFGDGTAADSDLTATVYQAQDVAGTGAKALNALQTGRIYSKMADADLTATATWTKETQATADEEYTDATSGEKVGQWVFEIYAQDLDVSNNFDCVRCDIAATSAAKVVGVTYILHGAKYPAAPELMLGAIAD